MSRSSKVGLGTLGILILLVGAAVYLFDWNMLRKPIAQRVQQATGRNFAINGNLSVRLSRVPRIIAERVVVGNAPWAREPNMAEIGRVDFTFDAVALWHGRVVLPEVNLSGARILFEKNADGAANWDFDTEKKYANRGSPEVGVLALDRAHFGYRDPTLNTDVETDVFTIPPDQHNAGMWEVSGRGRVKGMQATIDGVVGNVLALASPENLYPISIRAGIGTTKARITGALIDPLHLKGEDLNFDLEGADLAQLYPLLGVPLPPTPTYELSGHLNHSGDVWRFHKFAGRVGDSDLAGDFELDRSQKPQFITATLVSRNLDMKDIGGFVGADRGESKASPKPPPPGRVLPQEPFSLEKLRAANADVKFRGERVVTEKLPFEKMTATLKLRDGVLSLEPLNFGVAGGNLVSQIRMDARQQVIKTHADIGVRQLRLEKLFPGFKLAQANAGIITGRAKLDTTGTSVAKMLAEADGDASVMMEGGSVSELLVRLINLDVANAIPVLLTGDKQLPVRCMVTHLQGVDGDFKVRRLVLDTGKAIVTGSGGVNFADELLDLELASRSKNFSLVALRGPIKIRGTFQNPAVSPDLKNAAGRTAGAVALGWATGGLGALITLVDFGGAKDSNCGALIQEANAQVSEQASHGAAKR